MHPKAETNVESPPHDVTQHHRSHVNGLGMWSAWERNFSNKLKACLDLIDNAVDAALWDSDDEEDDEQERPDRTQQEKWEKQKGRIHISTEEHRFAMGQCDDDSDDEYDDSKREKTTQKTSPWIVHDVLGNRPRKNVDSIKVNGNDDRACRENDFTLIDDENTLCLHNDCVHPVKELRKILDVYNSDKTESAIGENGVGVKQAAAAMSDLSIIVTTRIDEEPLNLDYGDDNDDLDSEPRVRKCLVSIGILSKKMQSKEACTIPSWTLPIEFCVDLHNERKKHRRNGQNLGETNHENGETCWPVLIRELANITANNELLGKTMKEYGGAAESRRRLYGIQRLAKHIELMITSSTTRRRQDGSLQPPHPHQYLMIMHKFGKHHSKTRNEKTKNAGVTNARNELDELLRDLKEELPKTYLHIPPAPYFKIKVNRETLNFQYWERHLVELHKIPLFIDRRNDFRTAEDWIFPENPDDNYKVNVSIGFDPTRANLARHRSTTRNQKSDCTIEEHESDFIGGQACSLLIFSRISGRLFLKHDDARGVLRLTNSGTNFCQGLTILVDDHEGHLPLTPTKESLAFGLEEYGKIHERNMYAWLGALASAYWNHFFKMFKTKTALGNAVEGKISRVKELQKEDSRNLPTIQNGCFSTVEKLFFSRDKVRDAIRPYKSDSTRWILGPHTLIKLKNLTKAPITKNKTLTDKKRKLTTGSESHDRDENDQMPSALATETHGSTPENDLSKRERLDGRPVRSTREPQRFEEEQYNTIPRKKKFKGKDGKGETMNELLLKKRLNDVETQLQETKSELNASKAKCDNFQMELKAESMVSRKAKTRERNLERKLNAAEKNHKKELARMKAKFSKKIDDLMARVDELQTRGRRAKMSESPFEL